MPVRLATLRIGLVVTLLAGAHGCGSAGTSPAEGATAAAAAPAPGAPAEADPTRPLATSRILFQSDRDRNWEVYLMNPDGSDVRNLSNDPAGEDTEAVFAPDGRAVAWVSERDLRWGYEQPDVVVSTLSGSAPLNVASHPASDCCVVFSPDGRMLAWVSGRGGDADVVVAAADGSGVREPAERYDDDNVDLDPTFTPDGERIVWVKPAADPENGSASENLDIHVIGLDGSGHARLTNHPAEDTQPAVSPDGTRIAFVSDRDGDGLREIHLMRADGSGEVRLTAPGAESFGPVWSPDGGMIAFVSYRDGNAEVYVMAPDGSRQVNLSRHAAEDSGPVFSPDGARIAFNSLRDGDQEIYVVDVDGSDLRRLTDSPGQDQVRGWR